MIFRLLCAAMILGIVLSLIWLIVELRADKRDQTRCDVTVPQGRLPPKSGL